MSSLLSVVGGKPNLSTPTVSEVPNIVRISYSIGKYQCLLNTEVSTGVSRAILLYFSNVDSISCTICVFTCTSGPSTLICLTISCNFCNSITAS